MNVRYDMIAVHVVRPDAAGTSHEFLQLRRSQGDYLGGTWQIVRGTANPGEKAWEAALRELKEETGLSPREFYKLSLMEQFYLVPTETVWHVPSFVAIVGREDEVRLNEEHEAWRWIPRDRIDAETMWAGERLVLAEVMREVLDGGLSRLHLRVSWASS
jgi:dihydroneopterin triphosphate diphosphatase